MRGIDNPILRKIAERNPSMHCQIVRHLSHRRGSPGRKATLNRRYLIHAFMVVLILTVMIGLCFCF
jgi:hypothetical protein